MKLKKKTFKLIFVLVVFGLLPILLSFYLYPPNEKFELKKADTKKNVIISPSGCQNKQSGEV